MTHFGIITPPVSGHIHPFGALGRELIARGHRVTCFHMADLQSAVLSEGLEFCQIGSGSHPPGSLGESLRRIAVLKGFSALRFTIHAVARTTDMVCRDGPAAIRESGVDMLLVDQMEPSGGTVADHLQLPFITVCNALAINQDPIVPPPFTPWAFNRSLWARVRNRVGYAVSDRVTRPITQVIDRYRRQWNLRALRSPDECFSTIAQISQMPREFDFPRLSLPPNFHYVGPIRRAGSRVPSFPWERLDGRPLIYASLGTLQNRREPIFRCIAEASRSLDVQVVIAHGGGLNETEAKNLPGDPIVVGYAPQLDVLRHARLTITHAGLNTVLDSLTHGVPLITVPLTYEQPAIARRVERTGVGQAISINVLNPARLRCAIEHVLGKDDYRDAARRIRDSIGTAGGVARAADIIDTPAARF